MSESSPPRHLLDALLQHAVARPDAIAIQDGGSWNLTWSELLGEVERTAGVFDSQGWGVGTRIVYECRNTIPEVIAGLACIAMGAIEIPIDSRLPESTKTEIFDRSGGQRIDLSLTDPMDAQRSEPTPLAPNAIGSENRSTILTSLADRIDIDRPSLVLWTSGTTARARGAMLSQSNLTFNAMAKLAAVPQSPADVRLTLLSISHAYARTCDLGTWLLSGCRWTLDLGGKALDRISEESRPTMMNVVPTLAREILRRLESRDPGGRNPDACDRSLSRLSVLGCGGAALDAELYQRFVSRGIDVIQGYGCTETSPVIATSSPGLTQPGRVGPPIPGCETRIVDGRLFVRGPLVMIGYLDDATATAAKIDSEGWLDTGDLVELDPDGQMRILGRADDVIVLDNGYKIHPTAIERAVERAIRCDHAVLMPRAGGLVLLIQSESELDRETIDTLIRPFLPSGTPIAVEQACPALSHDRGELTAKGTVRRHVIARRWTKTSPERG